MTNHRSGKSLFEPKTQVKADMGIGNTDTLEEGDEAIHNWNEIKNRYIKLREGLGLEFKVPWW